MGHNRLGALPRTIKWKQVVSLIEDDASAPIVANATLEAAQNGLEKAGNDPTLIHAFWLLTQIPQAAILLPDQYYETLHKLGISITDPASVLGLTSGFNSAIDNHLEETGGRTDIGEMGQMAANESLTHIIGENIGGLFESTPEDIQQSVRNQVSPKNFGILARDYLSRFIDRYLGNLLSRELSNHVGRGLRMFNTAEHCDFENALSTHARQITAIVEDFSKDWFSKHLYGGDLTPEKVQGFLHIAFKKIRDEIGRDQEVYAN